MNTPLVSIIIPTYNYGHFLNEAIESALGQTYPAIEVIVVDDGSTDHTQAVVATYGSRIRYHYYAHQGVYSVRQTALALVHGEYLLNLDADNRLAPEFVAKTMNAARPYVHDPKFAFVYTYMEQFGEQSGLVRRPQFDPTLLKRKNYIDMNSLIRIDIVRKFGFDPAFNSGQGDYDFFLTLARNGYHGILVPEPLLYYRVHPASITHSVMKQYRQREIMMRLLRKHSSFFTPQERHQAIQGTRNSILVAIITNRSHNAPLASRINDLGHFLRTQVTHAEILNQLLYTVSPKFYFRHAKEKPSP